MSTLYNKINLVSRLFLLLAFSLFIYGSILHTSNDFESENIIIKSFYLICVSVALQLFLNLKYGEKTTNDNQQISTTKVLHGIANILILTRSILRINKIKKT
jgi:hypothetical protein